MADRVTISVDLTEFNKAIREYAAESRLTVAESINKKAIDLAMFANEETKKAHKENIPPVTGGLYHALASARPGVGSSGFQKAAQVAQERIKKQFGGRVVKGSGKLNRAAARVRARRSSAVSYSRALWLKVAAQLGAAVTGLRKKSDSIKNTSATPAKRSRAFDKPFAILTIEGIEAGHVRNVMEPALNRAVSKTIKDTQVYINRKLAEKAKARSGRK